jgi:hypothetical protein
MQIEIIKCNHVTATEKRHLKAFLESGQTQAKVNTKYYCILSGRMQGNKWIYRISINTPIKNDFGKKIFDTQNIEISVTK